MAFYCLNEHDFDHIEWSYKGKNKRNFKLNIFYKVYKEDRHHYRILTIKSVMPYNQQRYSCHIYKTVGVVYSGKDIER